MLAVGTLLIGCASSGPKVAAPPTSPAVMFTTTETVSTMVADRPVSVTAAVAKPKPAVMSLVRQVMADYNVQLTIDDVAGGRLGNAEFYKTRQFAGKPMADLFNCGMGMTGPNAATYRIYISMIFTVVDDSPRGSLVGATVSAAARDMSSGATADRITCGSTGQLEKLALARIKTLAGG